MMRSPFSFHAFLPEILLLTAILALFLTSLGNQRNRLARQVALGASLATLLGALLSLGQSGILFDGAYQVDTYSQLLKAAFAVGLGLIILLSGDLPDIQSDVKPEYYLFLFLSVLGLNLLVSTIEVITLVIALELSSFPLYLLVAMRRERPDQRVQMESAVKYIMFGIAANGVMFFGLSYLFGLTGTTSLPELFPRLQPVAQSPLAVAGLALTFGGLYYKLAVFPFQFWTPDVYQGASNETASLIGSLPKLGAIAVLVRFVTLATPDNPTIAGMLTVLAVISMFYGNLIALRQTDLKRLLGFSGIAHAGYALVGLVALDRAGYTAALFYMLAYLLMVLACFVVICRVSKDGTNVGLDDLAGLHRRAPLLALTLVVGLFALAGLPPFAGFMGKVSLLTAVLAKGHLTLVILTVVNAAIAVYYYLSVVRQACFTDAKTLEPIVLRWPTRALCLALIGGILGLGIAPARCLESIAAGLATTLPQRVHASRPGAPNRAHPAEVAQSHPAAAPR